MMVALGVAVVSGKNTDEKLYTRFLVQIMRAISVRYPPKTVTSVMVTDSF